MAKLTRVSQPLVKGYPESTLDKQFGSFVTIESFLERANGVLEDALDLAISYCRDNDCKVIKLESGKRYIITKTHKVYSNITIVGDRDNRWNLGSTSYGPPVGERADADDPFDSSFIWKGAQGTTWFDCDYQVSFIGIVFGAPDQNWAATTYEQLLDYGICIKSKTNTFVSNCTYYGMRQFVDATGQNQVFMDNCGAARDADYTIRDSRDTNYIINCHSNPGITRVALEYAKAVINTNSVLVDLINHDGTSIQNCMTFAKRLVCRNVNNSTYLGHVNLDSGFFDQVGAIVDNNTATASAINASNLTAIGGSSSKLGDPVGSDSGFFILRRQGVTQIASVNLSNLNLTLAASPLTTHPAFLLNFQISEAYAINLSQVSCQATTDNGAGIFCAINGSVIQAANTYVANPVRENFIPNAGWGWRHPINSNPRGWTLTNVSVESQASRRVTSSAIGGYIGTKFRQLLAGRTYIFTATSVGSSTGVDVLSTNDAGTTTTTHYDWVRRGGKYYATGYISTEARIHEVRINCGNTGSSVVFEYAACVPGSITTYGDSYNERPPKSTSTGLSSYQVALNGGVAHEVYPDYAGKAGAYTLYLSSDQGAAIFTLVKATPTTAAVINSVATSYVGSETYSVSWPDNSQPRFNTSVSATVTLTLVGAAYISDM